MELDIRNIDFGASEWTVTKAIAGVLHKCPGPFVTDPEKRPPNFLVNLNPSACGGVGNNGTGSLKMTKSIASLFLKLYRRNEISVIVGKKQLKFYRTTNHVGKGEVTILEKAPFIDPDIAQERQRIVSQTSDPFLVARVQVGTFFRPKNAKPSGPRQFSVEWELDLIRRSLGWLFFEYEYKSLRVQIGDPLNEQIRHNLIIKFTSISKMAIGHDFGNPYICFDLLTPPVIQKEEIFLPFDDDQKSHEKYRHRVGSLNPGHEFVAPYAHHLRIVLYDDSDHFKGEVLTRFENFCKATFLRPPIRVTIDASQQGFFSRKKTAFIDKWFRELASNWRVAFQIEALLHNGAANTEEVMELKARIEELIRCHRALSADTMRFFAEAAVKRPSGQTVHQCFENALQKKLRRPRPIPPKGRFYCHHVTFTPTRLLLEGPTVMQSNRVIREYEGYEDHFIRVDFRDEDRLAYRWDRDVDGSTYLQERVGTILKKGFDLAGRHFEFLAYSSSALREHSVWFVSAFGHPQRGFVTATSIRESLGDFSGVIRSPSKYGARMAQAFSGTDPSVRIHCSQWSVEPDIEENGVNFTDGAGTISPALAEEIWQVLRANLPDHGFSFVEPTAYQIRFLGFKGVVYTDTQLEGKCMRLRESMKKFDVPGEEYGTIEIALAIGKPHTPHLNRSLVMVLEDRGAAKEAFLKLQEDTVASTRMAHDSVKLFAGLLESHRLCFNYRVAEILRRLRALGFELKADHLRQSLDTPFLARLRSCAINDVLRSVKHDARIPIPNSHMLVGVADEGPAYVKLGRKNVYCLPQGKIFACVQKPEDKEPQYLQGMCLISRSPVIHPGDVQRVYAIGKPPEGQLCLFSHLKNVVVFPSVGTKSLANSLAGGDLDGDLYDVVQYPPLLVPEHHDPAAYPAQTPFKLDRESTIDDLCDFIVEYINSDVVGLVSDKHIVIAVLIRSQQSGTLDSLCLKLAEMHSQAVDYPKNGNKVDIQDMPRNLIKFKPDWHKAEQESPHQTDYYESTRALGHLYRNIELEKLPEITANMTGDPISRELERQIRRHLQGRRRESDTEWLDSVFSSYHDELVYMSTTYTLAGVAGARLLEEELVVGTILAKCSQKRYRKDRVYAMKENVGFLVQDTRRELVGTMEEASEEELRTNLASGWAAWEYSTLKTYGSEKPPFGICSFGLIALGVVLECLERLGSLPPL
ncbi:RNA dependent RNA polymerase-domain-containing protein [Phlebopus sp. FC_14]|nr:RNA dependent RNA polymerase-domain-containing protein [Phlebopus sp. FC_14]